jgi:hypothetical protein
MAGNNDSLSFRTIDGAIQQRGGIKSETLTADLVLDLTYGRYLRLDPGGAARNVDFAAAHEVDGASYKILNTADAAEALTIRDSADATIVSLAQNEMAEVVYDGSAWAHMGIITIALS